MVFPVKVFIPYCSCGERLASRQREYEKRFEKLDSRDNIAQSIVLDQMGWTKICCRQNVYNAPLRFVRDSLSQAIILEDEKGVTYKPAHKFEHHIPYKVL